MAQLSGVKTVSDSVIEYEGKRYEKTEGPVQFCDLLRCDDDTVGDVEEGAFYLVSMVKYGVVGFVDDDSDERGLGEDTGYDYDASPTKFTVFRRVESAQHTFQSLGELCFLIERKRSELAELEARLAEESALKVGDWARVIRPTHNEDIRFGAIVRVIKTDDSSIPYYVEAPGGVRDWARSIALEKLTPAEARTALLAEIDELFTEEAVASAAE
ncbi:hypothetical protein [Paenibacillus sp. SN-8-1]|uniref:hypothetical protein n=1 Tax=Paenibacillus sp. SN-8-1 TaxID=3435409 RepID=UPI003D9AAAB5